AYSGAKDPQKAAADNIEAKLKKLGIDMTHLIAPDLEHKFPPEWQAKADVHWSEYAHHGRDDYPPQLRFTTYTMKYASSACLLIMELDRHYHQAAVEADSHDGGCDRAALNV